MDAQDEGSSFATHASTLAAVGPSSTDPVGVGGGGDHARLLSTSLAYATTYDQRTSSGYVFTTRENECMWMSAQITTSYPGDLRYKPWIQVRATEDYAHYGWYGPTIGYANLQCRDTQHQAAPFTMHIAEHLAVWAQWLNNWVGATTAPSFRTRATPTS